MLTWIKKIVQPTHHIPINEVSIMARKTEHTVTCHETRNIVTVRRPTLTEEERERRMSAIKKAAVLLVLACDKGE